MIRGATGRYETSAAGGETVRAFVPAPLPPQPDLDLKTLLDPLEKASLALGSLDSFASLLSDPHIFLFSYVRKEAVLSSQIEGTQSSLSDLFLFELEPKTGAPFDEITEVSNYVAALEHGLRRMREGFPFSNRLIREIHATLLRSGRGNKQAPGEFRRSQNWIGGTRPGNASFVPPPAHAVEECMSRLERFLHFPAAGLSPILRSGLAHVQFETIHPFLDGNGRVGRLLITLLLCHDGVLREPLLYPSLYLKQHRDTYYALLDEVRRTGDWERWLTFFLDGVAETATDAVAKAQRMQERFEEDRARVERSGRAAGSRLRIHQAFRDRPVRDLPGLVRQTELSFPTVSSAVKALERFGVVREITGKARDRVFAYEPYLAILNEGTEP
ncbi:Fic family protein [Candidatus Palauibacter soopunensis]|uniref:Fic family protein n=1 Tax=Candidatus Palauibacter soopunensis TaxID=3056739 RepID=UPI00238C7515|nr:Fic family protein [Candidatus Palauibacter soopunensis]MDE2877646.1 Fic family protein [Candidatus Palauibacter soopunensis]